MKKNNIHWELIIEKAAPIMITYLVMGLGCGLLYEEAGYGPLWNLAMSIIVFSSTMQFAGISMITAAMSYPAAIATALLIQARHMFFSISMIPKYKDAGHKKWYLLYALSDENYSIVSEEKFAKADPTKWNSFWVCFINQIAWVIGTVLGATIGSLLSFNSAGMNFAMTAMFTTIFLEEWLTTKNHVAAITGLVATAVCRIFLGTKYFLLGAMIVIMIVLTIKRREIEADILAERERKMIEAGVRADLEEAKEAAAKADLERVKEAAAKADANGGEGDA